MLYSCNKVDFTEIVGYFFEARDAFDLTLKISVLNRNLVLEAM
jgi:hypothetical protein